MLERLCCQSLGDLHGKTYEQISKTKNCGRKTIDELEVLVHQVNADELQRITVQPKAPQLTDVLFIPQRARGWALFHLPLSVRLAGVLEQWGCRLLGDLHGKSLAELRRQKNCGRRSLNELHELIQRIQAGEFDQFMDASADFDLAYLIIKLNERIGNLPSRAREILFSRLGAHGQAPLTLEELGQRQGLTRERIRQLVNKVTERLRRESGPALASALSQIAVRCQSGVYPLTPDLLAHWLGAEVAICRFSLPFYLRLFSEFELSLPVWIEGQARANEAEDKAIARQVRTLLSQETKPIPLCAVFDHLRALKLFSQMSSSSFLRALWGDSLLRLDFSQPEQPTVIVSKLKTREWVRLVLGQAERPMKPEELIAAGHKLFGVGFEPVTARVLEMHMPTLEGFYLLGPRSLGLRQHIELPAKLWPRVRNDVYDYLKSRKRPASSRDVITEQVGDWVRQTNAYELAYVLREDERFVDQGRLHFALTDWGKEEREHINDLLPSILAQVGRPIKVSEIIQGLRQHRSVHSPGMHAILKRHPQVRDYGYGFFGLTAWDERMPELQVSDAHLVNRAVSQAEPPLTFADLCRIMGIPSRGKLTDQFWQTVQSLPRVSRQPERQPPETRLSHRNWRLERLMGLILEEAVQPLPLYEIHWELNARVGIVSQTPVELERLIEQSRLFVRDRQGRYQLASCLVERVPEIIEARETCRAWLAAQREIVGCDELLDRLGIEGQTFSASMLAAVLRADESFEEIGVNRFRVRR